MDTATKISVPHFCPDCSYLRSTATTLIVLACIVWVGDHQLGTNKRKRGGSKDSTLEPTGLVASQFCQRKGTNSPCINGGIQQNRFHETLKGESKRSCADKIKNVGINVFLKISLLAYLDLLEEDCTLARTFLLIDVILFRVR